MNRWVIDCSMALSWCLPDETSGIADRFFSTQTDLVLHVPALFWYETANALSMALRRKRLSNGQATQLGQLLRGLPVITGPSGPPTLARLLPLATTHNLTAYDAAYLDLAIAHKSGLATTDKHLIKAAHGAAVRVFE